MNYNTNNPLKKTSIREKAVSINVGTAYLRKVAFIETWKWLAPEYDLTKLLSERGDTGHKHRNKWTVNKAYNLLNERRNMDIEELSKIVPSSVIERLEAINKIQREKERGLFLLIANTLKSNQEASNKTIIEIGRKTQKNNKVSKT